MRWSHEAVEQADATGFDVESMSEMLVIMDLVKVGMGLVNEEVGMVNEVDMGGQRVEIVMVHQGFIIEVGSYIDALAAGYGNHGEAL